MYLDSMQHLKLTMVCTGCEDCASCVFQPLDQGIISILKTQYKYQLLNKVIEAADHYDELQVLAKQVSAGRKKGSHANMAVLPKS